MPMTGCKSTKKTKTGGEWNTKVVCQPQAVSNYDKFMNAVDRSDQILASNNVLRKCMRSWKTLFFHLIDIAVVNSFLLFKEHQAKNPDNADLQRGADYALLHFREELVRQLCDFPDYDVPPVHKSVKPAPPVDQFETVHMPQFSNIRRRCVVCYKRGRGEVRVFSYCSAPQCGGKYMHITKQRNCFKEFHDRLYHNL